MPLFTSFLISLSLMASITSGALLASGGCQSPDESDQAADIQTYQQFLKVLLGNPRFGTAWDRVYEFHSNRGTLQTFHDALADAAELTELKAIDATDTDGAIPKFTTPPDPGKAAMLVGMLDLQHVDGAAAVAAFEQAVTLRTDDPIANWYLGKAHVMNRQFDAAPGAFERAIACRPAKTDLLEIYKELARTLQRSQQDAAALAAWQQLENLFPGDLRVKEQIATALALDGRWQDALARYEAMASESKDADQRVQANLSASDLMLQLGRPQDAIALLEKQLATLDADSWLYKEIRRRIEATYRRRDDLPGLVAYYENWIKKHTDDVDAMARLGRTLSLQNQTAEAAAWYRKAIALAPTNVALRESLIEQLVRDNQLSDAIDQYEQMAKFDAGNLDHVEFWGQLYLSNKDLPLEERRLKAAAVWERLLTNRADDPLTIARLAMLLRRAELRDRAIALYQSAIEKAPGDPQYREYLGEYLHQLQRTDEALKVSKEIAAGERRSKANLIRLAEVLSRFGQTDDALAAMRDACGLKPDPAERIQFVEMLRDAAERSEIRENSDRSLTTSAIRAGNAGTAQPAMNGGQRLSDDKGKSVTDVPANPQQVARSGLQDLFTEAFEQLDLAEQSAETIDERQLILRERIKTLIAAGTLEEQTNLLAVELNAGANATAERWRTLALYQDAAEKLNDATASAIRVVELEPQSIAGWMILADLYERTGQLGDAVAAMKKLVALDRRGISEYLKKTARFQVRLGEFDNSLKTGRAVIKATPGNPEAYQFFADLAFEVGQPQAAVEALRQAVRVNPGDGASLRALAKTLADEFQTPEAIDLYWRAFEKAQDLESQTNIVVALSNLYLRSDQFSKLIERLELRSRELNLPTEMTRCIATAYREAGDFGKSRETLERLMIDESQNVGLLKELRTLAEQEHNTLQMEQYQRLIVELTDADEERRLLITILGQESRYDEAAKERLRLADSRTDRIEILKEIEILVSGGHDDVAEMLCERLLESSPDDWEALNAYRGVLLRRHKLAEAREVSRQIIRLDLDFDTASSVNGVATATSPATDTPDSFAAWLIDSNEDPAGSFGAVYCESAVSLVFRIGASPTKDDINSVFASHLSERDQLRLAAYLSRYVTARTPASDQLWTAIEASLQGPTDPARTAVQLFETCQRYSANDLTAEGQQRLQARAMHLLNTLIAESPAWLNQSSLPILTVLPREGFESEISAALEQRLIAEIRISNLGALWSVANTLQSGELLKHVFTVWKKRLLDDTTFAAEFEAALLNDDSGFAGGEVNLTLFQSDPETVILLLDFWESLKQVQYPERQNQTGEFLTLPEILNDRLGETAGKNLSACLQFLVAIHAEDHVAQWCRTKTESASPHELITLHLIRAELARVLDDDVAAVSSLIDAAESDPRNDDVRFLIAQLAAKQGLIDEPVLLLDSMNLTDPARQITREEFVLRLLFPAGKSERSVQAAERLFGLPLNMDQQRDLIPVLDKLGMRDKVAAMQSRFGRGSQARQSILGRQLQNYVAAGRNELAGEVAWELLKLASGGSLFSGHRPGDDRDDGGERLQAIKALGRLNRIQPLIDRYEAMLAKSPGSVELLEILAEFHDAAEQWDLLAAKRDRIALLTKKAPPSLKAKAVELEKNGDVSGACDIYLTILKDDPAAFSAEMETYVQAFERAKRQADFLTTVMNHKSEYWSDHASLIINVIAELARAKTNDEVVQKSIAKLLATQKTRRLATGSFLARPDVIFEERLLPAIRTELESPQAFANSSSCNEMFLILQGLKTESSLNTLHDFIISRRAGWRQPPGTTANPDVDSTADVPKGLRPPLADLAADAVLVYLDARLGRRSVVESRVADLVVEIDGSPKFIYSLVALNRRLRELGDDWVPIRRSILEFIVAHCVNDDGLGDEFLEELGSVYESLGQTEKARSILNRRIQLILASTGANGGNAAKSIRQLLQAGEKIQHSGFPIEGARLLLNVTAHDIDEFTSDLDDDKAVAFKSRFNASQRWARQQILADKLVAWFEIAVQIVDHRSGQSDLLLELTGTTDPRCHDAAALTTLRIDSTIIDAIDKQPFDDEKQRKILTISIANLLSMKNPPASLLTASMAFAMRLDDAELKTAVIEKLSSLNASATATDAFSQTPERSSMQKIPEALRSAPEIAVIFAANMLVQSDAKSEGILHLLELAEEKTKSIDNRLVRIAVLNECLAIATQSKLTQLAISLQTERDAVIAEQINGTSIGPPGSIDIGHEIRTRLLKQ
ncbi:MAG: tetratricopeptide repeat protein [Planctomycetota bacterium]|nr:tetratricopeptide repeat protein [Planctomycetota bacterium]